MDYTHKILVTPDGDNHYPVTFERLIIDDNGKRLDRKLDSIFKGSGSSINRIVNSNFLNPVNRNGLSVYTGNRMTIDMWLSLNFDTTVTVSDNGLTFFGINEIYYYFQNVVPAITEDGVYTLSGKLADGALKSTTFEVKDSVYVDAEKAGVFLNDNFYLYLTSDYKVSIRIAGGITGLTLEAVKLEKNYEQTLAIQDEDGNWVNADSTSYEEEYRKCLYYSPTTGEFVGLQNSNTNLLDNWYFVNPVNRQNFSGMVSGAAETFFMDRWTSAKANIALTESGISISRYNDYTDGFICQHVRYRYLHRQYTISAIVDGELYSDTLEIPETLYTVKYGKPVNGIIIGIGQESDSTLLVYLITTSSTNRIVSAMKCELGPVQTLAHKDSNDNWVLNDAPPNYELEYIKCIQYNITTGVYEGLSAGTVNAVAKSGGVVNGTIAIENEMEDASIILDNKSSNTVTKLIALDGSTAINVSNPDDINNELELVLNRNTNRLSELAQLNYTKDGNTNTYNLYGDHNLPSASMIQYRNLTGALGSTNMQDAITDILEYIGDILTVEDIPRQSGSLTYNGNEQSPTLTNYDDKNITLSGDISGVNAGTYTMIATPKAGYKWSDGTDDNKSITWTINKATINSVPRQSGSLTYNGSSQSPNWSGYDKSMLTIGGKTSNVDAGTFTSTFTPTSNYQWSDGSTSAKSATWKINKANGSLTITNKDITLNSDNTSVTINSIRIGDGVIRAISNDTSIATVTVDNALITINSVDNTSGNTTVSITVDEGTNYLAVTEPVIINVNCIFKLVLNDCSWDEIRAISDSGQAANYFDIGDTKSIRINGIINYGCNESSTKFYTKNLDMTIDAFIIGIDHNASVEGANRIHFQLGKLNGIDITILKCSKGSYWSESYNETIYQSSYWEESFIRSTVLGSNSSLLTPSDRTLLAALPLDLRNVMKSVNKYSTNGFDFFGNSNIGNMKNVTDYLWLLSIYEYIGVNDVGDLSEQNYQMQYEYYVAGNSVKKYSFDDLSTISTQWTRSLYYNGGGGDDVLSGYIYDDETFDATRDGIYYISPCFAV